MQDVDFVFRDKPPELRHVAERPGRLAADRPRDVFAAFRFKTLDEPPARGNHDRSMTTSHELGGHFESSAFNPAAFERREQLNDSQRAVFHDLIHS
jgi:hypothetical protein